jgi:protein TonB
VVQAPAPAPASGETRDARPLRQVPPVFPVDAARKRQEGWVELEFTIGADGSVRDIAVVRAQPTRVFDREAVRAMQQWSFEPALRNGQPVEVRARRRIQFQL